MKRFVIKDNRYRIGNVRLQKWLQNQPSYSVRRKVPTKKIKVPRVNYQWDGDLMDLSNIKVPRVNYQWDGDLMGLFNIKVPRVNYQWDGDLMDLSNIKVPRVNYQWDGDLMDLSNIKEHNNNVTFVLVVIDVFNRYAYIHPLKSKKTKNN